MHAKSNKDDNHRSSAFGSYADGIPVSAADLHFLPCKERENSHGNSKHAWGSVRAIVNVYCEQFQVDETYGRIAAGRKAQPAAINVSVFSTCFDITCIPAYQEEYEQRCLDPWDTRTQSHVSVERSGQIKSRSAPARTRLEVLHCVRVRGLLPAEKLFVLLESTLTPLQVETRRFSDFTCVDVFPLSQQACR